MHEDNSLSTPWLVAAAVAVVSTSYQVGFFSGIGSELISLASPLDWLFSLAVSSLPTLMVVGLLGYTISFAEDCTRKGGPTLGDVLTAVLFGIMFLGLPFLIFGKAKAGMIMITVVFILIALSTLLGKYDQLRKGSYDTFTFLCVAFVALVISSFSAGLVSSKMAGRECVFERQGAEAFTGEYLRSVSAGHIVRSEGKVYVLSTPLVPSFNCDEPLKFLNRAAHKVPPSAQQLQE
jgi:hypothetical protein